MGEPVKGVVVAHADLAEALVRTVERIAGVSGALVALSNQGRGPEEMRRAVATACGEGPAVVFTDLASGSCALAGRFVAAGRGGVAVVTGANLPMLLDFVFHRDMELGSLARRLVLKGREGVGKEDVPSDAGRAERVDRPASG